MSIIIKGLDMPQSCIVCPLCDGEYFGECLVNAVEEPVISLGHGRRADCPLIEIVECKDCKYWHKGEWYNTCDKHIGHGFEDDYFCADAEKNPTQTNTLNALKMLEVR